MRVAGAGRGGRRRAGAGALALLLAAPGAQADTACSPGRPSRSGSLPSGTGEASGIAASSRYPGWGWVVRDSGNPASLYAIRFLPGRRPRVRELRVKGADNTDWEDIVYARNRNGSGRLYVVESGQTRRDRFIYKMGEPAPWSSRPVDRFRRYRYAYPGGRQYNTEAAFFYQSHLVLVTKTSPARLYRFDGRLSEGRVNRPRFVGVLPGSDYVSVARMSPEGQVLVAANHQRMYVYRAPRPDAPLEEFVGRRPVGNHLVAKGDNVEAGDFFPAGACDLLLVAESKNIYRVEPRPGHRTRPPPPDPRPFKRRAGADDPPVGGPGPFILPLRLMPW